MNGTARSAGPGKDGAVPPARTTAGPVRPAPSADPLHERRLAAARELSRVTQFVIVGGVAVHLYGAVSAAPGLVVCAPESDAGRRTLERSGLKSWVADDLFMLAGVEVRLVGCAAFGRRIGETVVIESVRVPALNELVGMLLASIPGTTEGKRARADVAALTLAHGLDKRFAARLPAGARAAFKEIVDAGAPRMGERAGPAKARADRPR